MELPAPEIAEKKVAPAGIRLSGEKSLLQMVASLQEMAAPR
jgi:hypothetical protein